MSATRSARAATVASLAVFAAFTSMLLACAGEHKFDLTLRTRDYFPGYGDCWMPYPEVQWSGGVEGQPLPAEADAIGPCSLSVAEIVWTDGGERRATQSAYTLRFDQVDSGFAVVDCAGRTLRPGWWFKGELTNQSTAHPLRLVINDGSTVSLVPERAVWADNFTHQCAEYSGRWRGIAGDLDDRTGSFTMIHDSVQAILHLVED